MFANTPLPPNQIHLSPKNLIANFHYFQQTYPHSLCAPDLSSNAIGHGLLPVAKAIDRFIRPPYLITEHFSEVITLQKAKIKTPILYTGLMPDDPTPATKSPLTYTIHNIPSLQKLASTNPQATIHILMDTGRHDFGLTLEQLPDFIDVLRTHKAIQYEGIFTHLTHPQAAIADEYTAKQLAKFGQAIDLFRHYGFLFKWRHVANTAGLTRLKQGDYNLARLDCGFYGISPFPKTSKLGATHRQHLKGALRLTSTIVQIKSVDKGDYIGDGSYFAARPMKIGVIPLGTNHGLPTTMQNRGVATVNSQPAPIIGPILPTHSTIDLSDHLTVSSDQPVTIYDDNYLSVNSLDNQARHARLTPAQLLTALSPELSIKLE